MVRIASAVRPFAPRPPIRPVAVALAALAALALSLPAPAAAARRAVPVDTLGEPPTLRSSSHRPHLVEVELVAAPARIALRPGGPRVAAFAYNGSVPGPTLDVSEGDSVVVHFRNALPEATTVHWHGLHLAADADGSPFVPIGPGESHDYAFRVPPGSAGTYWYHPHPDRRAARQVALGLFGAIIVRAADDPLAARRVPEKLLVLYDNRFAPDGSVAFPDSGSVQESIDLENGREGDVLLVNGQEMPGIQIARGELQRWRVVNASAARVYRIALNGQRLLQVGSDGGLFERPVDTTEVLVPNSGRVELLVRGTGEPGNVTALEALPYDRYMPQTRPADWTRTRPLLSLRTVAAGATAPGEIPPLLRPVPPLDTTDAVTRRVIVLSQGLIDGRQMDMHRVDLHARLGTTEIWEIENVVGMDHPFHLHGFRFQVLDRDGVPEPYPSWLDTVNVPKHSSVRIVVRFDDFPGKWMYHCHILDHEDEGMMGVLEVSR